MHRKLGLVLVLVVLSTGIVAGAVIYLRNLNSTNTEQQRVETETGLNLETIANSQLEKQETATFDTDELSTISKGLKSGDLSGARQTAEKVCPSYSGDQKYICYGLLSQVLIAMKEYPALVEVAKTVLQDPVVQADTTLRVSWTQILEGAELGQDPATLPQNEEDGY